MKKLVMFGAGNNCRMLLAHGTRIDYKVVAVVDNDPEKWGKSVDGYNIKPPVFLTDIDYDKVIVSSYYGREEIHNQLREMGVPEEKIEMCFEPDGTELIYLIVTRYFICNGFTGTVPFKKGKPENYTEYHGETFKAHDRRVREGFFEKYCRGEGLDIGWNGDLLCDNCSVWDIENGDAQYLHSIEDESFDFVYSSHCLEHVYDVRTALKNWFRVVKKEGYLIIAIPHRDLYEKKQRLPSRWNTDHKHMFLIGREEEPDTLDIVKEIKESLEDYDIIYIKKCDDGWTISDPLLHSNGEYQIEIVIRKHRTEY